MSPSFPPPPPHIFTEGNSQRLRGQCKTEIQEATLLAKVQGVVVGSILSSEYSGDFSQFLRSSALHWSVCSGIRICLPMPKPYFWSPDADSASFSTRKGEEQRGSEEDCLECDSTKRQCPPEEGGV